jgi:hypothetical protein
VACLVQFESYGLTEVLAATVAMALGLPLYYLRGRGLLPNASLDAIREAIYQRETPLARALLHPFHRHPLRRQRPVAARAEGSI